MRAKRFNFKRVLGVEVVECDFETPEEFDAYDRADALDVLVQTAWDGADGVSHEDYTFVSEEDFDDELPPESHLKARLMLKELQGILPQLRMNLITLELVKCAFPDTEVSIHWFDGEDHEVILDVTTGGITAGGGRGFMWDERGLDN